MDNNNNTNSNTLYLSRCHVSCDIRVQIPEELYKKYKSGEIDRESFEESVHNFVYDDKHITYEINYFDKDDFSEMVEDFLEEQEQEEVNKLARIAELEAELTKLKEG